MRIARDAQGDVVHHPAVSARNLSERRLLAGALELG
jgi:hypothetical protein